FGWLLQGLVSALFMPVVNWLVTNAPAGPKLLDVRFGSKVDICTAPAHVRFTPESGRVQCTRPIADITAPCLPRTPQVHLQREQQYRSLKGERSICRRALVKQKWHLLFHQIARALLKLAASRNHDDLEP